MKPILFNKRITYGIGFLALFSLMLLANHWIIPLCELSIIENDHHLQEINTAGEEIKYLKYQMEIFKTTVKENWVHIPNVYVSGWTSDPTHRGVPFDSLTQAQDVCWNASDCTGITLTEENEFELRSGNVKLSDKEEQSWIKPGKYSGQLLKPGTLADRRTVRVSNNLHDTFTFLR